MQLVIAAITIEPCRQGDAGAARPRARIVVACERGKFFMRLGVHASAFPIHESLRGSAPLVVAEHFLCELRAEIVARVRQRDPILRAARPGHAGLDRARSSSSSSENTGSGDSAVRNKPCALQYVLDQLKPLFRAPGGCADIRASCRRPEKNRSSRRTRAPCWPASRDPPCSGSPAPAPSYSTNLLTTPFLRSICVMVRTRSVAVAPGS